ncbi:protein mono-ADP-ribosyltransferase PARP15-like [Xiphophorus hellerii]|uniref:protein mono-ADP-ribosyltransferase PARP15-like n=1 Tax=Xiphophorus hellerii TaxID=8084 RepID=UPI0013B41D0E|nr:protein mono-ADP-ribosyltransferase PARP15-like [Xiphophorus hellerii]
MYFPGQQAASGATPGTGYQVEVVQGAIEDQQDDAIVCPMIGHDPLSSRIGKTLSNIIGEQLKEKFNKETEKATLPGETVVVDGLPGLKCKAVIFLNLLCWDNNEHGSAVQVLRHGVKKILDRCKIRGYNSVALPMLGTGAHLRFPRDISSIILLEETGVYGQNWASTSPFKVRIIVHPKGEASRETFSSAQGAWHQRGFTSNIYPAQGSFHQCTSVTDDKVTAMIGGVKLELYHGDIINAGTDVIVNTTDFTNHQTGVSKAILKAAGPNVYTEFTKVGIPASLICTTAGGKLGCKEIIHARFMCSTQRICSTCKDILQDCERKGFGSVAFPAINTGQGDMNSAEACKAMLDGVESAIRDMRPYSLSLIRIIMLRKSVFKAFRSELESRCKQDVRSHLRTSGRTTHSSPQDQTLTLTSGPGDLQVITGGPSATKEKGKLTLNMQCAMKDRNAQWQNLSLHGEEDQLKKVSMFLDVETRDGCMYKLNLNAEKAAECDTDNTLTMKNKASEIALELPPHWELMNGDVFKKVALQPDSPEYQEVAEGLHKATNYYIHKIERVQNVFLWHAFSICRRRILSKNGGADLGEKFLYHGTSAKSCDTIERDRFDRSYAGQHAAVYGRGVYFAVNASYSADKYSPPDETGLKRLYVARVITGRYTVGSSTMRAPPPRGADPTDCFDSLVNNKKHPSIFVIFRDDQAYPEYLITFS